MTEKRRIRTVPGGASLLLITMIAMIASCDRDVRLAGRNVPSVKVRTVSHFGVTLDREASPEPVAFVALRAIREDVLAGNEKEREAALAKQFDVCAANIIQAKNRSSIKRDPYIYNVVYHWAPTVSHYVKNFDLDWEQAKKRLIRRDPPQNEGVKRRFEECTILMELDDPTGDAGARVVMVLWLARDDGYWRVLHLGFDNTSRSIGT